MPLPDAFYFLFYFFTGCDTTSRLFGIGKGAAVKKLRGNSNFKQARVFITGEAVKDHIMSAGEEAMICLYEESRGKGLDTLRYRNFREKVATRTSSVPVHTLPPTAATAKYHNECVYYLDYQTMIWMGIGNNMNAEEWGWVLDGNKLEPIQTNLPPAPGTLLKVVRCNCKTDCVTQRCTCRKLGLE